MKSSVIGIEVEPRFRAEQSDPSEDRYFFSYTITISNRGERACQLLSRYWLITDGNGNEQEVRGEGVVGQQPRIGPGKSFTYTSGAMLDTPVGTMQGSYSMIDDEARPFEVEIPPFLLAHPGVVN